VHCEEFERRLNALLDERRHVGGDAELSAHACGCPACDRLLRHYEAMLDGIALLDVPQPPAELTARVLARHRTKSEPPRRRRALVGMALAATLVIAALPAVAWLGSPTGAPIELPAQDSLAAGSRDRQPRAPAQSSATQSALIDQVSETYQPLLAATGDSLISVLDVLPVASSQSEPGSDKATSGPVRSEAWERDVVAGLQPVVASASRSVAALFRILPGSNDAFADRGMHQ
jgi:hypothetical protein